MRIKIRYHHTDSTGVVYYSQYLAFLEEARTEFLEGVGPKTMRALSLVSEVIYGAKPSYEDPARYSFAHGGKDGTPYAVDRKTYDTTIQFFTRLVQKMKVSPIEKNKILTRLRG